MRKLSFHFTIFFCLTLIFSSCSKDGDSDVVPCSAAWATDLQPEFTAVMNAASAYAQNESDANCNAFKSAYQDYINALKPYGDCATLSGQNRAEWQAAVAEAEAEVAGLCN
jgi:hypothetical protein